MSTHKTNEFINALHRLEEQGDVEALVPLFDDTAEVSNPTDERPHTGPEGVRRFWKAYRDSFEEIHSEFRNITAGDGAAMLEWVSKGRTASGEEVVYDGVSVLEFGDDGIHRFRAYFDPTKLSASMPPQK